MPAGLLGIEELIEPRGEHQCPIVSDRDSMRFAFQKLNARTHLPNRRVARLR